eukprot:SAG31_NODE_368_length_16798_cov_20.422780_13_plen_70_part_00
MAGAVVGATLAQGPVVVFSKTYCPFCDQTKKLFGSIGALKESPVVLELDIRDDGEAIQDELHRMTGGRR